MKNRQKRWKGYNMNILRKIKGKYYYLKEQFCGCLSYFKLFGKLYDFDCSSVLEVEKHQLKRIRKCLIKTHHHVGWEYDLQRINLTISLLDKIIESDSPLELINQPQIFPEYIPCEWKIIKYVNTKNASKFIKQKDLNFEIHPILLELLYEEKLWYLYNKVRQQYLRNWWI